MAGAADDVGLTAEQQLLLDKMGCLIDAQSDGLRLMSVAQDLVAELLRRECDASLREQTLGEVSRFFLGILKAPNLSDQYKLARLKSFARATLGILIDRRRHPVSEVSTPAPSGLARRATDHGAVPS